MKTPRPTQLGKRQAFDPYRSQPRDPEVQEAWREIKETLLDAKLGDGPHPRIESYGAFLIYLGDKPEGAVLAKWKVRQPHGLGNSYWNGGDPEALAKRKAEDKIIRRKAAAVALLPSAEPKRPVGRPFKSESDL